MGIGNGKPPGKGFTPVTIVAEVVAAGVLGSPGGL